MSFERPQPRLRPLVFLGALALALALQTTLLNALSIHGVKPDLMLVVAICAGLLGGPGTGAAVGAVAGMMEGFAQASHVGSLGLTRALAAFMAGTIETHLLRDNVVVPVVTVSLGSLVAHTLYFVMAPELPMTRPIRIGAIESLLNMLFAPPIYLALARWGRTYRR